MNDAIATDQRGNALLAVHFGDETDLDNLDGGLPCPFSLVLAWHDGCCLMVFDRWKQTWELPGGSREPDETPRAAALRELIEETGQAPSALSYLGVARFRLASDGREEFGAIYQTSIDSPRTFTPTPEIEQITWWDPAHTFESADSTDAAIVHIARRHQPTSGPHTQVPGN